MAYHIPFNQRHSTTGNQSPVYIGFDVPAARPQLPRKKFNWWGFNGLWMSFASLFSAGFLSPIPLLISLVGLRRPGKKMATLGTLTSLMGVLMATAIVFSSVSVHKQHRQKQSQLRYDRVVKTQVQTTQGLIAMASKELTQYRDSHDGELPDDIDANMLVIKHVDPWGESLRYDAEKDFGIVRSAGPDKTFDTSDDLVTKIDGKTDRAAFLDLD